MSVDSRRHPFLSAKVPKLALVAVRVVIGYALLIRGFWSWVLLKRVYGSGLCTLPNFDWLPTIPNWLIPLFGVIWCVAACSFMLGIRVRLSGSILVIQVAYFLALDQQLYASHLYLMGLICGVVTLASYFDGGTLERSETSDPPQLTAYWPLFLLKVQLSVVYFFAAVTKFTPTFLSGEVIAGVIRKSGPLAFPEQLLIPPVIVPMVWGTIFVELFLSFAFWLDSTRRIAFVLGVFFHLSITTWIAPDNFWELLVFTLEMFALYSVYFWKPIDSVDNSGLVSL